MESLFGLQPGEVPEFQVEFLQRGWNTLGTYLVPNNMAVVNEFYTNGRTHHDQDP